MYRYIKEVLIILRHIMWPIGTATLVIGLVLALTKTSSVVPFTYTLF